MSSKSVNAIEVTGLSKCYRLYDTPAQRLIAALTGDRRGRYREHWALRDVSFAVPVGKTIGIIGENGSGKSTLLQMVAGTLTPTAGQVQTIGKVAALLELGAGFNPEFTGYENVFMTGSLYGLSHAEVERRLPEIEAFAEIGEFISHPVKTYSSGMFVRLAFAVIAHVDANVLIVDEALAVGDAYFTQKCMRFLRLFMEKGSVLFVSHDMAAVRALADEVLWIDRGGLRMRGDPKAVGDEYLRALYAKNQSVERPEREEAAVVTDTIMLDEDCRRQMFDVNTDPNMLIVSRFNAGEDGFGDGAASIVEVTLAALDGSEYAGLAGGEEVVLSILIRAHRAIDSPIVGFFVRNRFGQNVFGDNTHFMFSQRPRSFPAGSLIRAAFTFRMPFLPPAEYSICAAVASGSLDMHVQHHWLNEALIIRSVSANVHADVLGIPMHRIELEAIESGTP